MRSATTSRRNASRHLAARLIGRLLIPAGLGLSAIGLAACGVQGPGAEAAAAQTTSTTTSSPAECASQNLAVSSQPLEAAGPSFLVFTWKNIGAATCTMRGVPYVTFTDAAGKVLSKPQQSAVRSTPVATVNVAPGKAASYWIEFLPCEAPPANDSSTSVKLTAADVTSGPPPSVPFDASPGCQTLMVSPIASGVAYPPGFTAGGSAPSPIPPAAERKVQARKAANPSRANNPGTKSARARTCAAKSRRSRGRHVLCARKARHR
jgi:Protein of unknown function (DUF4232)